MASKERAVKPEFDTKSANNKGKETSNCYKKGLVVTLTFLAVGETVLQVHLVVKLLNARASALARVQQRVCVPMESVIECSKYMENADDQDESPMCCDDASVILNNLVDKNMREIFKERIASFVLSEANCEPGETPVVATFRGIHSRNMARADNKDTVLWDAMSDLSVRQKVGHQHGRLKIQHSGYYYVYFQLTFHLERHKTNLSYSEHTQENIDIRLYHCSSRYNYCIQVLENTESTCDYGNDVLTSTAGAAFHLHHGDEMFVQSSHANRLLPYDHENIFWLYMI